jgi:hypothetical protein
MFWRGAVANVLADAIAQSGRAVRIVGYWCVGNLACGKKTGFDNKHVFATVVKDFQEPLDMIRLFSITALSGYFRIYGFKAMCSVPQKVNGGLGQTKPYEDGDLEHFLGESDGVEIEISQIWSESQAKTRLEQFRKEMSGEI